VLLSGLSSIWPAHEVLRMPEEHGFMRHVMHTQRAHTMTMYTYTYTYQGIACILR
jgi:hypothetical protein